MWPRAVWMNMGQVTVVKREMHDMTYDKAVEAAKKIVPRYLADELRLAELADAAGVHRLPQFADDVGIGKTKLRAALQSLMKSGSREVAARRRDPIKRSSAI